ncbi:MAG: hypothetical protein RBR02_10200, partial [Desulfuromonadaceae bacterium]|nr:hypothetical protein [Desulfuromonadaceae bacterium]
MTKESLIIVYETLDKEFLQALPIITIYGKITFSNMIDFANGGGVLGYIVTNDTKESWKVKVFFKNLKPEILANGTLIRVTGHLKKNIYKNKEGETVDGGLEIITSGDILEFNTGNVR